MDFIKISLKIDDFVQNSITSKVALFHKEKAHCRKFRHMSLLKLKSSIYWLFLSKQKVALFRKEKAHSRKFRHMSLLKLKSSIYGLFGQSKNWRFFVRKKRTVETLYTCYFSSETSRTSKNTFSSAKHIIGTVSFADLRPVKPFEKSEF